METLYIGPVAAAYVAWLAWQGQSAFGSTAPATPG